jgi:phage gp46-like protein
MTIISNDVVLTLNAEGFYDINFNSDGDLETDDFMDTALLMTIYCEQRATEKEVPEPERRRGWIGNESTPGFEIGSKVWLYEQARLNRTTINGLKTALENGLSWTIDENALVDFEVEVLVNNESQLTASIKLFRSRSQVDNKFFTLWENSGLR